MLGLVVFFCIIILLLALDLGVIHKKAQAITIKKSFVLSLFYLVIALLFGIWIRIEYGSQAFTDYLTAYLVEKSLSLDNIFVMSLVFASLKIPKIYEHRVLFWGILGAILMRGLFIGVGLELIQRLSWVLYIFGAFLIITGIKIFFIKAQEKNLLETPLFKWIRVPMTHTLHGARFWIKENGRWVATPLFMALLMIEVADMIFAIDSVPAVLAITTDPYIVYTSNIFAILGLRALYTTLSAIMVRFIYVKYALALILIFIGGKIFVAEFFFKIPSLISLSLILTFLLGGVAYSLHKTRS